MDGEAWVCPPGNLKFFSMSCQAIAFKEMYISIGMFQQGNLKFYYFSIGLLGILLRFIIGEDAHRSCMSAERGLPSHLEEILAKKNFSLKFFSRGKDTEEVTSGL